ncbi:FAD-dependent monooxygenase [Leptolyngbya sp. FACHB-17]|uniref:FAD-dependent monooxygenase n=1 Tax=unclassified Leptolyngbya TaxID=2650499 RepID=UPI0016805C12|nr:FAD-dependent monooxygenase [Leptolyngbya sp. FACHB-17]MBD2078679.1 FAD-dependent monooxygenase [Leptolyngbya sp. FACHB-17]
MNTALQSQTNVLIVGAGPTGLTLACELLRRGVSCRIIDKAPAPATTSRALGIQPRTLELFDTMGLINQVLSTGGPVFDANFYDGDRLLLALSTAGMQKLDTPYPQIWITPQVNVERVLTTRLHQLGGAVEWACELVDFRDTGSQVAVTINHPDDGSKTEEIQTFWLVGCDGAHSQVRKALGVKFEGSTYEEKFLLADVELDWQREHDRSHTWLPAEGMFSIIPLPNSQLWRVFAVVDGETVPPLSLELFQQLFRERTGDTQTTLSNPTWLSNFTINRRMVDLYRIGRVFLAGDAAHIHSPFGGQGMNTGIQDAYNLAWKLALVITGQSPEHLLNTYQAERLPIAQRVLAQTDANTKVLVSNHPMMQFLRERVLTLDSVQSYLTRRGSQLFIHYRTSSLSRSYWGSQRFSPRNWLTWQLGPQAGDRAPNGTCIRAASHEEISLFEEFRGTHFSLLLFAGLNYSEAERTNLVKIAHQIEALLGNRVKTHIIVSTDKTPQKLDWNGSVLQDEPGTLHKKYSASGASLYLIRPDGYIGFRSQPVTAESLLEYLSRLFLLDGRRSYQETQKNTNRTWEMIKRELSVMFSKTRSPIPLRITLYRQKTQGWKRPWGGWKDVEAS